MGFQFDFGIFLWIHIGVVCRLFLRDLSNFLENKLKASYVVSESHNFNCSGKRGFIRQFIDYGDFNNNLGEAGFLVA